MWCKKSWIKTLFYIFLWPGCSNAQDTITTPIILDSLGNEVYCIRTSNQIPTGYYSPIFTPVCIDGTCYPIRINLFWDLNGNYSKYTLDPPEILTKNEHLPFTDFDYGLLHRVIANPQSNLANFTIYELTEGDDQSVDGVTGATRPELQGHFVPDALFTSYTLWHLARTKKDAMKTLTDSMFQYKHILHYALNNEALGAQNLALKHLIKPLNQEAITKKLLTIMDTTDNGLTALCISRLPEKQLCNLLVKEQLVQHYSTTIHTDVKRKIIGLWTEKMTCELQKETEAVAHKLGSSFSTFKTEIAFLNEQKVWSETVFFQLYEKMKRTTNMMRQEKIKNLLFSREAQFPKSLKRLLKKEGFL